MSGPVKLLPCPFCGYEAEHTRIGTGRQSHIVSCTDCSASLESGETFSQGRDWNKRHGVDDVSAHLSEALHQIEKAILDGTLMDLSAFPETLHPIVSAIVSTRST